MPFQVQFRDAEGRQTTLRNVTKLEGVWNRNGELTHYCLYVGFRSTEHRRWGFVPVEDIIHCPARLPQPPSVEEGGAH